jgi:hypothetical protein
MLPWIISRNGRHLYKSFFIYHCTGNEMKALYLILNKLLPMFLFAKDTILKPHASTKYCSSNDSRGMRFTTLCVAIQCQLTHECCFIRVIQRESKRSWETYLTSVWITLRKYIWSRTVVSVQRKDYTHGGIGIVSLEWSKNPWLAKMINKPFCFRYGYVHQLDLE